MNAEYTMAQAAFVRILDQAYYGDSYVAPGSNGTVLMGGEFSADELFSIASAVRDFHRQDDCGILVTKTTEGASE